MNLSELTAQIAENQKYENVTVRQAKTWVYGTAYRCYPYNCDISNGYFNVDVAIEVAKDFFCEKSFSFKMEGFAKKYFDAFLNTAFPDQTESLNINDILGKAFIGKIVDNDNYDNLVAIDACEDVITPPEWMEVDENSSPF